MSNAASSQWALTLWNAVLTRVLGPDSVSTENSLNESCLPGFQQ